MSELPVVQWSAAISKDGWPSPQRLLYIGGRRLRKAPHHLLTAAWSWQSEGVSSPCMFGAVYSNPEALLFQFELFWQAQTVPSLCKRSNQPAGEVMRQDVAAFFFIIFFVKLKKTIMIKGLHKTVPIKQNLKKLSISWLPQRGRDVQRFPCCLSKARNTHT